MKEWNKKHARHWLSRRPVSAREAAVDAAHIIDSWLGNPRSASDCARKMNKLLTTMFALAVASATSAVLAQDVTGKVEDGAKKTAMCVGCHGIPGYQASFPEVHKVPMISGQSASFISAALNAYKTGDRRHPTMRAIADTLTEQDIADLAAYYSVHGVAQGAAPVPAEPAKKPSERLQQLIARNTESCTKCHGANFNTPNDGTVPKLAGQHADYLYVALKSYKASTHAYVGRSNAVMGLQSKPYTASELRDLSRYIASLPGDLKTVPEPRLHTQK